MGSRGVVAWGLPIEGVVDLCLVASGLHGVSRFSA